VYSIYFFEIYRHNLCSFIFRFWWGKWIYFLFLSLILLAFFLTFCSFRFNLLMNEVWVSNYKWLDFIIGVFVLVVQSGEWLENEVSWKSPIEDLLWELISIWIVQSHCDVIVIFSTNELSPEDQFFEVFVVLIWSLIK